MKKIRYAIIDDDGFAHDDLIRLMKIHTDFECAAHYFNVIEASKALKDVNPDFIFLDVEMPNLNGFELLNYIDKTIYIIITSSNTNYAYKGFEHQVFDFLSKPIEQEKLFRTTYRLTEIINNKNQPKDINLNKSIDVEHAFILASKMKEKDLFKLQLKEICSIVKNGNHVEFTTINKAIFYRRDNIYSIIKELPSDYFKIINRSTIVNISKVIWNKDKTAFIPCIDRAYKVSNVLM